MIDQFAIDCGSKRREGAIRVTMEIVGLRRERDGD
jgi:hypothetical protein